MGPSIKRHNRSRIADYKEGNKIYIRDLNSSKFIYTGLNNNHNDEYVLLDNDRYSIRLAKKDDIIIKKGYFGNYKTVKPTATAITLRLYHDKDKTYIISDFLKVINKTHQTAGKKSKRIIKSKKNLTKKNKK